MLNVEERFVIRELHRQGVSISEIARRTGHDRKTVRKVISGSLEPERKSRVRRKRKIDPYIPYLLKRMAAGVLNARKLYGEIVELGYQGKESQVRRFVQPHRKKAASRATVRFETQPGQQAQVDWGHFGYIQHQGKRRRLYAFLMTLGWSRAMYLEFTISAQMAWWLRCHVHAFRYLGGAPQEILHDNLKTAVLSRAGDGSSRWHPRYLDFAEYYGFAPRACQPYRAQTKGKVESGVRYVRGNFWPGLEFTDLDDLNYQALGWLNTVANVRIHGTTGEVPFERLPEENLAAIHDRPDYDTSLVIYRRVSSDCFISYEGNLYSVPSAYAEQRLMVKVTEDKQLSVLNPEGETVAWHRLATDANQRLVVKAHYEDLHITTNGADRPGAVQVATAGMTPMPWPDAPTVVARPLATYQDLVEMGA